MHKMPSMAYIGIWFKECKYLFEADFHLMIYFLYLEPFELTFALLTNL